MAYGQSNDPFLLKEGNIFVGTFASYPVSATADPASVFSGDNIGYFKQGTVNITVPRNYAEFRSGTPSKLIRKDLIQKDLSVEAELGQWNSDLLKLLIGTNLVTNPGNFDNHFLGSDEPNGASTKYGFRVVTERTDDVAFEIGIWNGISQAPDFAITLSGTDYATLKLTVTAFTVSTIASDVNNLGYFQIAL